MTYQKRLQNFIGVIFILVLIGCSAPKTTSEAPTATQVATITARPNPTVTPIRISNFKECVASGNPIEKTYPHQCSNNGNVFEQTLERGAILGKAYKHSGSFAPSMTVTSDNGYLILGGVDESDVFKLSALGKKEWEYNIGPEFTKQFSFKNAIFGCLTARETSNGGYVIMVMGIKEGGCCGGGGWFFGTEKFFTIELDRDGKWVSAKALTSKAGKVAYLNSRANPIWLTSVGMSTVPPRKVIETLDGGYAIAGLRYQSSTDTSSIHLVKTDPNGSFVWEKNLCQDKSIKQAWEKEIVCSGSDARDTIQADDGGYVITGARIGETWLIKTNPDGNIEWFRSYPQDARNEGWSLIQLHDGGYLIAGYQLIDKHHSNGMLIKTDSSGMLQWARVFGGDLSSRFTTMKQGFNNEIILLGWIENDVWLLGIDLSSLD
jgi:hypothetical protein